MKKEERTAYVKKNIKTYSRIKYLKTKTKKKSWKKEKRKNKELLMLRRIQKLIEKKSGKPKNIKKIIKCAKRTTEIYNLQI